MCAVVCFTIGTFLSHSVLRIRIVPSGITSITVPFVFDCFFRPSVHTSMELPSGLVCSLLPSADTCAEGVIGVCEEERAYGGGCVDVRGVSGVV